MTSLEVPLYEKGDEGNPSDEERHDSSEFTKYFSTKGTIQGYKDAMFLILFLFSLLIVGAIALTYGSVSLANSGAEYWIVGTDGEETEDRAKEDIVSKIMLGLLFILSLSTVVSLAWVYLLSYIAIFMVNAIIISLVVISVVGSIVVLSLGYPSFGFLLLAVALATLLVSLFFQSRIEFASVNLDIACKAVVSMPSTIGYSLLMLLFQAAYVLVWSIAAIGFATNDYKVSKFFQGQEFSLEQCSSYTYGSEFHVDGITLSCAGSNCHACICEGVLVSNSPCFTPQFYWSSLVGLLLALVWTNAVMVNIVHCTVVAAVARWWTTGTCTVEALQYFFGTFTSTSLGSICFGSLLGAIVRTMRAVTSFLHARVRRSNDNSFLGKVNRWAASMLDTLLTILDRMIVYFNRYAFCYVAIEEYDYIRASYAATTLFRARGFTALLNDDLLDFVMYISNTLIACVTMIAAYIFAKVVRLPAVYLYLLVVFGFFCGYVMGAVVLSTISSAITAVYVCFARDPAAFQAAHPHLYTPIATAWSKIFPTSQQLLKSNSISDPDDMAPSTGKKVRFSSSAAVNNQTTIHGSYGRSSSAGPAGTTTTNLHQRELGPNRLGMIGKPEQDDGHLVQPGFWSSSLVQMVQQNLASATTAASAALAAASASSSATNANRNDGGGRYTRIVEHDLEVEDGLGPVGSKDDGAVPSSTASSHHNAGGNLWGVASNMAATFVTDLVTKKSPFSSSDRGPSQAYSSHRDHEDTAGDTPPTWAPPSFSTSPFPPPTSQSGGGLHGGYGDYQLGYTESVPATGNSRPPLYFRSHTLTGPDDDESDPNVELQTYAGI